ncbi:hypothetical protein FCV44_04125 [Vibrio kanaloae]|uniref:hypothetical protein n=1 Tax=Vibrio kanaloae TaxID=170673 RepID=UPI0010BED1A4|nr:hypothetical protein [Vibrio kanaloae]TKF00260.1 hypothetical protein FCV44_04125 [Vibrio kanaloae]TKF17813.1 hypothetical protein FCV47_07300 [Vibrio kanaloae]TKF78948.1 hypothetical protein FCV62_10535 [Vibrio kanaloae]
MLAFLKKWRQAYRDEKGDRLHAEVEAGHNILNKSNVVEPEDVLSLIPNVKEKRAPRAYTGTETECMIKGYYY